MTPEEDPPKIIVDSDWKAQVAKEKMAAAVPNASQEDPGSHSAVVSSRAAESAGVQRGELPPASFEMLLSMMFTQGMSLLGHIPNPSGEPPVVDKPLAKHTIDTLDMLVEKTKGNLSDEESKMLGEVLHALRLAFVSVRG